MQHLLKPAHWFYKSARQSSHNTTKRAWGSRDVHGRTRNKFNLFNVSTLCPFYLSSCLDKVRDYIYTRHSLINGKDKKKTLKAARRLGWCSWLLNTSWPYWSSLLPDMLRAGASKKGQHPCLPWHFLEYGNLEKFSSAAQDFSVSPSTCWTQLFNHKKRSSSWLNDLNGDRKILFFFFFNV